MKAPAYLIANEPALPERFAFLENLQTLLAKAYSNPKSGKLTQEHLLGARQRAVKRTFAAESLLRPEALEAIKNSIRLHCKWDTLDSDLQEITQKYQEESAAIKRDNVSYNKDLNIRIINKRISRSTLIQRAVSITKNHMNDLKSKEVINHIIDKFINSQRISGKNSAGTAQAIYFALSFDKKLREIGCSQEYTSWAVASALDSGSYSSFHALNYAEMDFLRDIYGKLDIKSPIFLLSRENHNHRLASCFERNRTGWDCEHDVYQCDVDYAAKAFEMSKEYGNNDYVRQSFMQTDAHKTNAALEYAFHGVDLNFVPDAFRNESLSDAMLSTMHGDEQRKNWESAARTASSLGREYLRRGYLEEARELADRSHSYLLNLLSEEDRKLAQGTYVLPVVQNNSPTAWAGWMALRARTDFEMLKHWGQEPKMNIWNLVADAAKLYAGSGAMSWSMSARKTANRVAEHYGSTTRI
ncbi:hypothetical protein GR138_18525 [Shinella kummerowiae]|uniref:Uncharacterized protein n=1 Tax=Shinella kummerowiae TaxID=417745 RepID=A0A6N8SIU6_9HYPH|nr:hypothetical protein [Shinella kummerowiae]MXN47196.1 hypothetical protein [Shinella kummerowiae]